MDTLIVIAIALMFVMLFVFSVFGLSQDDDEFDSTKFLEEQEAEISRHNDFS
jgi:hypothetical protein